MSDIFAELQWRGLIHQTTSDELLPKWLQDGSRTVYIGFDPTSDSMHIGNLMQVITLSRFQKAGHKAIALVGGATGMIGDPSGKSDERQLLTPDLLQRNVDSLKKQMQSFLDFSGDNPVQILNNFDWMGKFSYLEFLRDVGKNFPVNVMMAKDSVKSRLGREDTGISYTEFSYMLLQAYDFVHLNQEHGCELQVGGSDQWGNITAGIDLGRRMHSVQLYGMTSPLLTKTDGTKMGKTESGAIWLDPAKTSPYDFYQYWYNVNDEDVSKCLRFLTDLTKQEIEDLDAAREADAAKRESQTALATLLTKLVHGEEGLKIAERAKQILFGGGSLEGLNDASLGQIFADVPSCEVARSEFQGDGFSLIDALAEVKLCSSKSEARRTIKEGGAYVNNNKVSDIETRLGESDLASESVIILRRGKRKYGLVRLV